MPSPPPLCPEALNHGTAGLASLHRTGGRISGLIGAGGFMVSGPPPGPGDRRSPCKRGSAVRVLGGGGESSGGEGVTRGSGIWESAPGTRVLGNPSCLVTRGTWRASAMAIWCFGPWRARALGTAAVRARCRGLQRSCCGHVEYGGAKRRRLHPWSPEKISSC